MGDLEFAPGPGHDPEFSPPPAFDPGKPPAPVNAADRALGWVSAHRRAVLVAGVVFQVLVLLSMVGMAVRPLVVARSRTVLLRVVPVDPRDLFRGDYVTLSYEVSQTPVPGATPDRAGQPVYVTLAPDPDGRHYHGVSASFNPPGDGLYLRGTLGGRNRITFGIESYFVPEGKGKPYEDAARQHKLSAEVTVAPDGQPALKGLVIE